MSRNYLSYSLFVFYCFILCSSVLKAQIPSSDINKFSVYLIQNKKYNDALHILKSYGGKTDSIQNKDSISYLTAYCFLKLDRLDSARKYFSPLLTSSDSVLKRNSIVFCNHISVHLLDSIKAVGKNANQREIEINRIHSLSFLLLMHNYKAFKEKFDKEQKCKITELSAVEFDLLLNYYDLIHVRKKSRFLAGFFSAIIPGSGKLYTGKNHEAFISFLPVALNGAQAAEGYYHQQFKSPHFYVFGGIGFVFYSSNIYGSARSATISNEERYEKIRLKILSDLDAVVPKL